MEWGAGGRRSSTRGHCCDSEFCALRTPLTRARPLSLSSCSCLCLSYACLAYLPCPCDGHKTAEGPQLTQPHSNGTTEPADWGSRPCSSNAWKRTLPLGASVSFSPSPGSQGNMRSVEPAVQVQIPALPFRSCATFSKVLSLSVCFCFLSSEM